MSIGIASGAREVLASTAAECFLQNIPFVAVLIIIPEGYWSRSQQKMFNARFLICRSSSVVYKQKYQEGCQDDEVNTTRTGRALHLS